MKAIKARVSINTFFRCYCFYISNSVAAGIQKLIHHNQRHGIKAHFENLHRRRARQTFKKRNIITNIKIVLFLTELLYFLNS